MTSFSQLSTDADAKFLVRWRGRQEGPYGAAALEAKLAANEIGLLHELFYEGKWLTIREYIAEREAVMQAERRVAEEAERRARDEADREARLRHEHNEAAAIAEERRRNDLLEARLDERNSPIQISSVRTMTLRPHRGGTMLALAVAGLFVFGPLCLAAWIMGSSDLREMNAGRMDPRGRSATATGRNIGVIGTLLWLAAVILIFVH